LVQKCFKREKDARKQAINGCHWSPWLENEIAWYLATFPDSRFRDPDRAAVLAAEAVSKDPKSGGAWNTLGVARYRQGKWQEAIEALKKASALNQGREPIDGLFLAMAHWQLGQKTEAREWFDRTMEIINAKTDLGEEVRRFQAEATALLQVKAQNGG